MLPTIRVEAAFGFNPDPCLAKVKIYVLVVIFCNLDVVICPCLSEECSRYEPEGVGNRELVLHKLGLRFAGMRIVPLVGGEARHDEQGEAHQDVGGEDVTMHGHGAKFKKPRRTRGIRCIYPHSQISTASGFMKEKSLVGFPDGILSRMEMPRFMKGLVKSMICSLA